MHPVLKFTFVTPSYKIAVSYLDLAEVTRAQLEFYMASVSVILLLFVQTSVSCDKRFRDFGRGYVLFSRRSHLMFFFCKKMTSTVHFSILYGVGFFESFSLSPNCTGIRHRSSWKLYSKFASCFRTRLSAFHISIVNIHTFTR